MLPNVKYERTNERRTERLVCVCDKPTLLLSAAAGVRAALRRSAGLDFALPGRLTNISKSHHDYVVLCSKSQGEEQNTYLDAHRSRIHCSYPYTCGVSLFRVMMFCSLFFFSEQRARSDVKTLCFLAECTAWGV